jgi:parallel beta-helix repeat protein
LGKILCGKIFPKEVIDMRKRSCILVLALSLFWGGRAAYGDFYVISGGRGAGTGITSLPYTITAPGFYYLTKNLSHNGTAITVNADNVTIDLMGFSLSGPGSGTNYGIDMNDSSNVEIRNGTIRNFGTYGIYADSSTVGNHRIINVRVVGNQGGGIRLYLVHANLVKDCTVSDNGGDGISAGYENTVTGNVVYNNVGQGIHTDWGALVTGNNVYGNTYGGISVSSCSMVRGNTVFDNGGNGIDVGPGSTVVENTSDSNGSDGIRVHHGSTVRGNTASYNQQYGIDPFSGECLLDGNTAISNNQSGSGYTNIRSCASCTLGLNQDTP